MSAAPLLALIVTFPLDPHLRGAPSREMGYDLPADLKQAPLFFLPRPTGAFELEN